MPPNSPDLLGAEPLAQIGLGLGSNIGDRAGNIRKALALLQERRIVRITAVSSVYRTAPWGYVDQDFFANACALAETRLTPLELLEAANAVEIDMGRAPSFRWGPRLIDIDILFYGETRLDHPQLHLPHRNLFERAFVLAPLAEIAPGLTLLGRSIEQEAARFSGEPIEKWSGEEPKAAPPGET